MNRLSSTGISIVAALLLVMASGAPVKAADPPIGDSIVAGRVLLKPKLGVTSVAAIASAANEEVRAVGEIPQLGYVVLSVPEGTERDWVQRLAGSALVQTAQPEFTYNLLVEPNDFYYTIRNNDGNFYQWNLRSIKAPGAWDITTGSPEPLIAIVDTGVDDRHEDLSGRVTLRQDYVNEDNPYDGMGAHATHVAGIAAARTNNGTGIAGVSWGARLMSVKVADHFGKAKDTDAAQGIIFAADNGAKIINLSFGGEDYSQLLQDAVDYAYNKGILVVAAAGNCADPAKLIQYDCKTVNAPIYPAAGRNALAVSAIDSAFQRAIFSEHGPYVAVAAPGDDILSALPNQQYGRLWGTSMAAPHVSALANLIWTVNPSLTNVQVANIITSTVMDAGPAGKDEDTGYGVIDARAALAKAEMSITPGELGFVVPTNDTRVLTGTLSVSSLANAYSWSASVDPASTWLSISPTSGTTPASPTITVNKGSMGAGRYDGAITIQIPGIEKAAQTIQVPLVVANQVYQVFAPTTTRLSIASW